MDTVATNVSKIIEESEDSFDEFKSQYAATIWSDEKIRYEYALVSLEEKRQDTTFNSSAYMKLGYDLSMVKSNLALMEEQEMEAAIKGCSERHPDHTTILENSCLLLLWRAIARWKWQRWKR